MTKRCKCGLKEVRVNKDVPWVWESHDEIHCTELRKLVATTPPQIEFEEVETIYRMPNSTALHRRNNDNFDYKVVYPSGDTIYFNPDRTVKYVVDSSGKPWW